MQRGGCATRSPDCRVSTYVLTYAREEIMKDSRSARKAAKTPDAPLRQAAVYRGKQAKTGNSLGLRFERALFQSHPEFNGEVEAHIISPGRMLVVASQSRRNMSEKDDPVLASFLSFLARDMQ